MSALGDDTDRLALRMASYLDHHPEATYRDTRAWVLADGYETEDAIRDAWDRAQGMTR
jgi:hypothetical protein